MTLSPTVDATSETSDARAIWAVLIYVAAVLIIGALFAPVLQALLDLVTGAGILTGLADTPFRRVANRSFMIVAIVGLWPLSRVIGHITKQDLGLAVDRKVLARTAGIGLLAGLLTMLILVLTEYALGVVVWDDRRSTATLVRAFFSGLLSGVVISLIEEPVFRGFFHSQFRRRGGVALGAAGSAFAYALVHFIRSRGEPETITWLSGFEVLASAFYKYGQVTTIGPFVALFVVGVWLSLIREHVGHLGWGMGLHASWVAVIRMSKKATNLTDDESLRWLAIGYDQITGWLAAAWLLLLMVGWYAWLRRRSAN